MLTSLSSPLELEIVLLDFEVAVAVGETRLDQEQRGGDVYFASPRFLHDLAGIRDTPRNGPLLNLTYSSAYRRRSSRASVHDGFFSTTSTFALGFVL
jgi:hypothetical protein